MNVFYLCVCVCELSCVQIFVAPWTVALGAWQATVHGIFQARILELIAILFSRDLPDPRMEPGSPAL